MNNHSGVKYLKEDIFKSIPNRYWHYIQKVIAEAELNGISLYIVGGYVRDHLLGIKASDLDLVIEGDAIELATRVKIKNGGNLKIHKRFNTAGWKLPEYIHKAEFQVTNDTCDLSIDFISARKESYRYPGALPSIQLGSIDDDISRRDFSINTLAVRLSGGKEGYIIDQYNGIKDIQTGAIRVLHPKSFIDDPTRLIRAIRYEKRFGFYLTPSTEELIPESLEFMKNVSGTRIRHELELVIKERKAASIIDRLGKLKIATSVHPSLPHGDKIKKRFSGLADMNITDRIRYGWMLWLLELDKTQITQIDSRLHFTKETKREILDAASLYEYISLSKELSVSNWITSLDECSPESIRAVYLACENAEKKSFLNEYLEQWRNFKTYSDGEILKQKGLIPGPFFKVVLAELREAWMTGKIKTKQMEEEFLDALIKKQKGGGG